MISSFFTHRLAQTLSSGLALDSEKKGDMTISWLSVPLRRNKDTIERHL